MNTIRQQIFEEVKRIASDGPSIEEMEKLRNSLCNDTVRGRQSTMYRAQRLAEFALYDSNPRLFDSELDHYLSVTGEEIKNTVAKFLDVENRVVLDIVPAPQEGETGEAVTAATPQPAGDPKQPAAPASQVPETPPLEPDPPTKTVVPPLNPTAPNPGQAKDPADAPKQADSGPLHL